MNKSAGFTLIELMIVVAIIGILAAVAIPQFQQFISKSRQAEAKTVLKGMHTTLRAYHNEHAYVLCNTVNGLSEMGVAGIRSERYMYMGPDARTGYVGSADAYAAYGSFFGPTSDDLCQFQEDDDTIPDDDFVKACGDIDNDTWPDFWAMTYKGTLYQGSNDLDDTWMFGS